MLFNLSFFSFLSIDTSSYLSGQVANTCTRLQYIARILFTRFYNDDRLTYKKVKIIFHENEIRNFGSLAEKMWLHDCTENQLRLMIEKKCDETLRRIIFSNVHNEFKCIPGIESIFKNLEELSFYRCPTLINVPLGHCPSLTRLQCVGPSFKIVNVFPNLKYLRLEHSDHFESARNCLSIKNLLMNHMNLTEIICHSYYQDIMEIKTLEKLIIREFVDPSYSVGNLQRLNKLKVVELGNSVYLDDSMTRDIRLFLKFVPNPEILVELRLPRLRRGSNGFFHNLTRHIGLLTELIILKLDMYEMNSYDLRNLHTLNRLQQFTLRAPRLIKTDALIECIGHMEDLHTISFFNMTETNLLLDATEQVDIRLQQMYLLRKQQLTIKYLKAPPNNAVATEDFAEDLFELRRKQRPYFLYKSMVLNASSHS